MTYETGEAKRSAILTFLRSFRRTYGYSPSIREIVKAVKLSSTSIASYHLNVLVEQNKLAWTPKIARSAIPIEEEAP